MADEEMEAVIFGGEVEALRGGVARWPREVRVHLAYARALRGGGRLEEGARACYRALQVRPDFGEAVAELAEILVSQGKHELALKAWGDAVRMEPGRGRWWRMLGRERGRAGKWTEALQAFNKAVHLEAGEWEAWLDLGQAYEAVKQWGEAQRVYEEGVRRFGGGPQGSEMARRVGGALGNQKKFEEARAWVRRALAWDPKSAAAWRNLGMAALELGELEEAEEAYGRAVALEPESASRWCEWGRALKYVGKLEEAVGAYDRAVALAPGWIDARADRSMTLLLKGDWKEGFAGYELRVESTTFPGGRRGFKERQWRGEKLEGKTLVLYGEQGMGDTIQFLRFVKMAAERGGAEGCVVEVQEESLRKLAESVAGVSRVMVRGEAWPGEAVRCSLMSLPWVLGTTVETVPCGGVANFPEVPSTEHAQRGPFPTGHGTRTGVSEKFAYVRVDEGMRAKWRGLVGERDGRLRVGVAWSGSTSHPEDGWRSMPAEVFWKLARVKGVAWFCLQKGVRAGEAGFLPADLRGVEWMGQHAGFMEAAGLIEQMDLVIAVDTAAVHLAGALGKRVWTLLSRRPDWRWMMEREDSVWYPTMRLFRQKRGGGWGEVVERVGGELGKMTV